jgi:hypothetical protein
LRSADKLAVLTRRLIELGAYRALSAAGCVAVTYDVYRLDAWGQ